MKTLNQLFVMFFSIMLLWACKEDEAPMPVQDTPIANAGNDATATAGVKFELDASKSVDPLGGTLVYAWTLKTKPDGSTAALVNPEKMKAEFTADVAGVYIFELTVNNTAKSAKDEVMVTVAPPAYTGCTPKSGTIDAPTTWVKRAPQGMVDYCITDDIWIYSTLTIEPGVIIEFEAGKKLVVDGGAVKAIGTDNSRIVFTGKEQTKGYWKGIEMSSIDSDDNELSFVDITYAGSANHVSGYKAGLSLRNQSKLKINNTRITHSDGYGMVVLSGMLPEFSNNSFAVNTAAALYLNADLIGKLDTETLFTGNNGRNGVEVGGTTIDHDSEQLWPALKDGAKYYFLENIYIYSGIVIQEGAVLEFATGKGLVVDGGEAYLQAKGTAARKIVFTGIDKQKGSWKGVEFNATTDSQNEFDFVELSYAGGVNHVSGYKAGISARNGALLTLTNSTISNSLGYGLVFIGSSTFESFANNTFSDNGAAAMRIPAHKIGALDQASKFKGGNGREGIEVTAATVDENVEQLWKAFTDGSKYFVMDKIYIYSPVKIEAGAVFEFAADKGFVIDGGEASLNAMGTASKKIFFTGMEKTKGFWKGIEFNNSQSVKNEFDYCEITFGGSSNHTSGYKSNISLRNGASIKMYNSKVADSSGWGVVMISGTGLEADAARPNTYTNNTLGNIKAN